MPRFYRKIMPQFSELNLSPDDGANDQNPITSLLKINELKEINVKINKKRALTG
jgi:hypothetical protein